MAREQKQIISIYDGLMMCCGDYIGVPVEFRSRQYLEFPVTEPTGCGRIINRQHVVR